MGRRADGEFVFNQARVHIDEELLRQVYAEIDQLEKTEIEVTVFRKYTDLYRPLIMAGMLILIIGWSVKFLILQVWPD